jgi:hypothetical protein
LGGKKQVQACKQVGRPFIGAIWINIYHRPVLQRKSHMGLIGVGKFVLLTFVRKNAIKQPP